MKKNLSPAQLRQREERKEKFSAIVEQIGAMSESERAHFASKILVTNTEGHALSVRNQMLIALQLGMHCTVVGGFRQWLKQGRCVSKGQHGATILFPRTFGEKPNDQDGTSAEETAARAESNPVQFLSGTGVIELLKERRNICTKTGATKTAARVRSALSSAKGARRNAHLKDYRDTLTPPHRRMRASDLQRAVDETSKKMKGARRHES